MTWVETMPMITAVCYAAAAVGYWNQGLYGFAFMYASYCLANCGLVWAAVEGRG